MVTQSKATPRRAMEESSGCAEGATRSAPLERVFGVNWALGFSVLRSSPQNESQSNGGESGAIPLRYRSAGFRVGAAVAGALRTGTESGAADALSGGRNSVPSATQCSFVSIPNK